jgi:hypothetical protein
LRDSEEQRHLCRAPSSVKGWHAPVLHQVLARERPCACTPLLDSLGCAQTGFDLVVSLTRDGGFRAPSHLEWTGSHCPLPCRCPLQCPVRPDGFDDVLRGDALREAAAREWRAWLAQVSGGDWQPGEAEAAGLSRTAAGS